MTEAFIVLAIVLLALATIPWALRRYRDEPTIDESDLDTPVEEGPDLTQGDGPSPR